MLAGRGQVSWLPDYLRRLPRGPKTPQWPVSDPTAAAKQAPFGAGPVTVAGPRRLLTGLPLTTGRCRRSSYPGGETKRGGPKAAPLKPQQEEGPYFFLGSFVCLHFWTFELDWLEPSLNVVVAELTHFFFLQRAIT